MRGWGGVEVRATHLIVDGVVMESAWVTQEYAPQFPEPQTNLVTVPLRNDPVDLSGVLTQGQPRYNPLTIEFPMVAYPTPCEEWSRACEHRVKADWSRWHGRWIKVQDGTRPCDFEGLASIGGWQTSAHGEVTFVVSVTGGPFWRDLADTVMTVEGTAWQTLPSDIGCVPVEVSADADGVNVVVAQWMQDHTGGYYYYTETFVAGVEWAKPGLHLWTSPVGVRTDAGHTATLRWRPSRV